MTILLKLAALLSLSLPMLAQSSSVELLGIIPASQAATGLGVNVDPGNSWEFDAAALMGAGNARIQCSWSIVEQQQAPPSNAPATPQYVQDPNCLLAFAAAARNHQKITMTAAYGPPTHPILLVTLPSGAAVGATTLSVTLLAGFGGDGLASILSNLDYYICPARLDDNGNPTGTCPAQFTPKHGFYGSLITGTSSVTSTTATVALASALNVAGNVPFNRSCTATYGSPTLTGCSYGTIPQGLALSTQVVIGGTTYALHTFDSSGNPVLSTNFAGATTTGNFNFIPAYTVYESMYPPINTQSPTDPSVQAYSNYVRFLASSMAAHGISGDIEPQNEPCGTDPWSCESNLFDTPPATADGSPTNQPNFGFLINLQNGPALPAGVTITNANAQKTGANSLFGPRASYAGAVSQPAGAVNNESFHVYGPTPELVFWTSSCMSALVASAPSITAYGAYNCLLPGEQAGSNTELPVQLSQIMQYNNGPAYGLKHSITETGILPPAAGYRVGQARFNMRQFLTAQADGISPVEFFKLDDIGCDNSSAPDPCFSMIQETGSSSSYTPYQTFTSFAGTMADIKAIGGAAIGSVASASVPSVTSYSGTYPLSTAHLVGTRAGNSSNSVITTLWQRDFTPLCNGTVSGTVFTCSSMINSGACFAVGQSLSGPGFGPGTAIAAPVITSLGTGTCGVGNYNLSSALSVPSSTVITVLWLTQAPPPPAPVTVAVPTGMHLTSVVDAITRAPVAYTVASNVASFSVSNNPIEVIVDPPLVSLKYVSVTATGAVKTSGSKVIVH